MKIQLKLFVMSLFSFNFFPLSEPLHCLEIQSGVINTCEQDLCYINTKTFTSGCADMNLCNNSQISCCNTNYCNVLPDTCDILKSMADGNNCSTFTETQCDTLSCNIDMEDRGDQLLHYTLTILPCNNPPGVSLMVSSNEQFEVVTITKTSSIQGEHESIHVILTQFDRYIGLEGRIIAMDSGVSTTFINYTHIPTVCTELQGGGGTMQPDENGNRSVQMSEEGEWGIVYRAYTKDGELVAVKTGKALLSASNKKRLLKEVIIMLSFNHPNVMSLIGMCFDDEVPLLIMPYMSGGNVLNYVRHNRGTLYSTSENVKYARKECLNICHQIAKGMCYLALKKFIHRDLAARNCLIDSLHGGIIKVGDFGLAEDMYGTNYYRHDNSEGKEKVPIKWMAPECIETNVYSESTDVWSYGVTCWEVYTCGRVPYTGVPVITLLNELSAGHRLTRPKNAACCNKIWESINSCWLEDSTQRPTFKELESTVNDLLDSEASYMKLTSVTSEQSGV